MYLHGKISNEFVWLNAADSGVVINRDAICKIKYRKVR